MLRISGENWNSEDTPDITTTIPVSGMYTAYYIAAQKKFYLQGLDHKK